MTHTDLPTNVHGQLIRNAENPEVLDMKNWPHEGTREFVRGNPTVINVTAGLLSIAALEKAVPLIVQGVDKILP